jgi:S-adenosylmethionine-diacylglycerol 3-amino-3-carboxypropyl transferase
MRPPFGFGLSQEDERTEAAALALPGGSVLAVASAGDLPLSLAALGADRVVAVDIAESQIHLSHLKRAAVLGLEREEAIGFLGFLPATPRARAAWFNGIRHLMPTPTQRFWTRRGRAIRKGAVWSGRFERYLAVARMVLRPLLGSRFEALFSCTTLDEQRTTFAREFDRPFFHRAFHVLFHPRLYRGRGIDALGMQHRASGSSLGREFFERFRAMCTATPARDNHLLQLVTMGRVRDADTVPTYLRADGFARARQGARLVSFHPLALTEVVEAFPQSAFDRFHLSNVSDWLTPEGFADLLRAIVRRARRPARLVWRHLHRSPDVPPDLSPLLRVDLALGSRLRQSDRFPVYHIVPAEIAA